MKVGVLSQFSYPAFSSFPLILPLPHSVCQPHPPRQFTLLTCAHSCLSSHAISPAYTLQLHTHSFAMRDFPAFSRLSSQYRPRLSLIPLLRLPPGKSTQPSVPDQEFSLSSPDSCLPVSELFACLPESEVNRCTFTTVSESFVLQLGPYTTRYTT